MDVADDWAKILAAHPGVDTHLVLPASMRTVDLKRVAGQYSVFQPRKLLFTRLDETVTLGPILSLSIRMDKPISFFCAGQHIPEDLEPAAVDTLLDAILGRPEARDSKYGVVAA
jgi:flagellar biosynthesis protein FlhF